MKITTLTITKSRTINVEGKLGRDAYRKVMISMSAELDDFDNTTGYLEARDSLSKLVDEAIRAEVAKFNKPKMLDE